MLRGNFFHGIQAAKETYDQFTPPDATKVDSFVVPTSAVWIGLKVLPVLPENRFICMTLCKRSSVHVCYVSVCLSVCLSQVDIIVKRIDCPNSFDTAATFGLSHTVLKVESPISKILAFPSESLSEYLDLEKKFRLASRRLSQLLSTEFDRRSTAISMYSIYFI